MKTTAHKDRSRIIEAIVTVVREHLQPRRLILFGSRATGKDRPYSDFDIAVEGAAMDVRKERLLKEALDERLGIFSVDLVSLDKVDDEFRRLILEQGKVIYEQ